MSNKEFTYYQFSTPINETAASVQEKFNIYTLNFPETESDLKIEMKNNQYIISLKLHSRYKEFNNFSSLFENEDYNFKEII